MKYDLERIGLIIRDINDYFGRLDRIKVKSVSEMDDIKFDAASMMIFSIINKTIDLAKEIVVTNNFGMPKSYREIFEILRVRKVINKKQEGELAKLIILRNKISHRYEGIGVEDIFKIKNGLKIVKDFVKIIRSEMK